jgi:hypothetical protein
MNGYRRALLAALLLLAAATALPAKPLLALPEGWGGAGGPHFKLTWVAGQPAMLGGGPVYLIRNRVLWLGLNGSYLEGNVDEFLLGYGGPSAGLLLFPDSWVQLWLGGTVGFGGVRDPASGASAVFVLEPEANMLFALGPYCRLGLGGTYRWTLPFRELPGYGTAELSGFSILLKLHYGVFRRSAGTARIASSSAAMTPRIGIAGTYSQKFSLVRRQVARFDGGYTRLILKRHWALGAMGYRAAGDAKVDGNDFQMMESGLWLEYLFDPEATLSLSAGALTGMALVGYLNPGGELAGSAAFLFNPELLGYLRLSEFARLSAGLGFRLALPFQDVPGLRFWDSSGPTLSLNLVFGVF